MKTFSGLKTDDIEVALAGDIVGIAGFDNIDIGDTLSLTPDGEALPFVEIDPPTIQMEFSVNDGPSQDKMVKSHLKTNQRAPGEKKCSRIFLFHSKRLLKAHVS